MFLTIVQWLLLILIALGAAYWMVVLFRVVRTLVRRPTVRRGLSLPPPQGGWPRLSIIIPAHNEQRVIEACASSLSNQSYADLEILFVLDRCTDDTRKFLLPYAQDDERIVIIDNETCPEDWAGKCHASQLGAERATGEWLLFTDADTEFDAELCRAAVALAAREKLGLLSLLSTLTIQHPHDRIAQPVAAMNLIRMYPIERVNRASGARPFANGQFMLFRREWYERIGRHEAVKDDLLEDIAFARLLQLKGGRGGIALADGMLRVSMYSSLESFKRGWKRIFIEACKRKPRRLRKNAWRVLGNGIALPAVQVIALGVGATTFATAASAIGNYLIGVTLLGLLVQVTALSLIYRMTGLSFASIIHYPHGCWIVGRIMLEGARDLVNRRPIRWGGREYVIEPR